MASQSTSFYIPRVRSYWTEYQVALAFRAHGIGIVERVDFGDFVPEGQTGTRMMFVHICGSAPAFQQSLSSGPYNLQVAENEFWMILPNKNPLPKTHLNVHQLFDVVRKQDQRIASLEAKVCELLDSKPKPKPYLQNYCRKIAMASDSLDEIRSELFDRFSSDDDDNDEDDNSFKMSILTDEYADMPELIPIHGDHVTCELHLNI